MNKRSQVVLAVLVMSSFALSAAQQRVLTRADGTTVTITLVKGDIVKQRVDAVVNAANKELIGGTGVNGAIRQTGGPGVAAECARFPEVNGIRCPVGQVRMTSACALAINGVKHIIHAVGPDCRIPDQNNNKEELLQNAYRNSLVMACNVGAITSIALPSLSTGVYGYNVQEAARVAIKTVVDYVNSYQGMFPIAEIRFVLWDDTDMQAYTNALNGNAVHRVSISDHRHTSAVPRAQRIDESNHGGHGYANAKLP